MSNERNTLNEQRRLAGLVESGDSSDRRKRYEDVVDKGLKQAVSSLEKMRDSGSCKEASKHLGSVAEAFYNVLVHMSGLPECREAASRAIRVLTTLKPVMGADVAGEED